MQRFCFSLGESWYANIAFTPTPTVLLRSYSRVHFINPKDTARLRPT